LLVEQLRQEWRARRASRNYQAVLCFKADRLELGAGTVLAKAGTAADDAVGDEGDRRLTALLSVAYGPAVAADDLGHVRAAIARRKAGDSAAADLHLALSRLDRLRHPEDASRRLFMADGLMRGGVSPEAILEVLQEAAAESADLRNYNPDQPRVPAGSGRQSGEWSTSNSAAAPPPVKPVAAPQPQSSQTGTPPKATNDDAALRAPEVVSAPSASAPTGDAVDAAYVDAVPVGPVINLPSFGELSAAAARALARFIPAIIGSEGVQATVATGGVVGVLGILFVPSTGPKGRWVNVGGPGNISYYQNPDELQIKLKFTTPDGVQHVERAGPGVDGEIRTPDGRIVGRIVKVGAGTAIMVSAAALGIEPVDEPQLCPAYRLDRYQGPLGKQYEAQMKARFNPLAPTPAGMAYYFYDPGSGKFPAIDDCQQLTGALAEYKGPGFEEHMLKNDIPWQGMLTDIMNQSAAQARAAGDRPITWYFAEKSVADHFREVFAIPGGGRENIRVEWVPMLKDRK